MLQRQLARASVRRLSYQQQLFNSAENVSANLEKNDRSAYLLAQYVPEPARNAYLAIRAFALEVNKISDGSQMAQHARVSTAAMKLKFWSDMLEKAFSDSSSDIGEPTVFLLRDALRNGINLDIGYFHQYLQTRRHFLEKQQFASIDAIGAYGEGTYSQMNYATQAALLSPQISPSVIHMLELSQGLQGQITEIAAHIGQASALGSMILGTQYYAQKNLVTLPIDVMTKHGLSQEALLRMCGGQESEANPENLDRLKNVVFDTAVAANDHLLSARAKLQETRAAVADIVASRPRDRLLSENSRKWRHGLPDVVFTPFMVAYPTALYLERLESHDFDLFSKKLQHKEWRLAWRSFRGYYSRQI